MRIRTFLLGVGAAVCLSVTSATTSSATEQIPTCALTCYSVGYLYQDHYGWTDQMTQDYISGCSMRKCTTNLA